MKCQLMRSAYTIDAYIFWRERMFKVKGFVKLIREKPDLNSSSIIYIMI